METVQYIRSYAQSIKPGLSASAIEEWRRAHSVRKERSEFETILPEVSAFETESGLIVDLTGGTVSTGPLACGIGICDTDDPWVAIMSRDTPGATPVCFVCHDPPLVLLRYRTLHEFITSCLGPVDIIETTRQLVRTVYRAPQKPVATTDDLAVEAFRGKWGSDYLVYDMTGPAPCGFSYLEYDYDDPKPIVQIDDRLMFAVKVRRHASSHMVRWLNRRL